MGLGVPLVPLGVPCVDLFDVGGLGRDTAPKALTTQMTACDLRHVEPTAVLGVAWIAHFSAILFASGGSKAS